MYVQGTLTDSENICIDEPYETYDGGNCYEETYQPMYSNSSRNIARETDSDDCFDKFFGACLFLFFLSKFKWLCSYS